MGSVKNIIGIAAGKGGVGKSTMTVLLARLFAQRGARVGVLDADLYGPSILKMLGVETEVKKEGRKLYPAKSGNISYVSAACFGYDTQAAVIRAPIANAMIEQLVSDVIWTELDYLFVDFPPGTGDIQLTLMQSLSFTGAVLVTTPQEVALLDVQKAYEMFYKMHVPILGLIENMSYLRDSRGEKLYPFGQGGAKKFTKFHELCFLGEIPLNSLISASCDQGKDCLSDSDVSVSRAIETVGRSIEMSLAKLSSDTQEFLQEFELYWDEVKK